jgi:uncharacterized membrane protein YoaK (UPF0700 family)
MFRHQGKSRTLNHNKQIATLLSFVAGIVNVVGFFAVKQLTTNVTGHFAFFMDSLFTFHFHKSLLFCVSVFFFFLGSFFSSLLIEIVIKKSQKFVYVFPILTESFVLIIIVIFGNYFIRNYPNVIAFSLLFAMGLQNSLVTKISNAVVRTTHLTGLFTDLGIELAQLYFYKQKEQQSKLLTTIKLRIRIIIFFFCGGLFGGILFTKLQLYVLLIPATLLLLGLYYDYLKFKVIIWKRNYNQKINSSTSN